MKQFILGLALVFCTATFAQTAADVEINQLIKGSLFTPANVSGKKVLVILIAGSGPTNRSGNQIGGINNSLKYLAQGLATKGHYVFSYDKRIIAQVIAGTVDEQSLRFEHFVTDAKDAVAHFRATELYDKIVIAGHSEGSLIGMMAANGSADAFISLAGAGRTIDDIIVDQISEKVPALSAEVRAGLDKIKQNEEVDSTNPILSSLFRKSVQPYLRSWIALDPLQEIQKLEMPILILNGTKDMQVKTTEAELLKAARPDAQLHIITNMNHIFKEIEGDSAENLATYNDASLPVMPELIDTIDKFLTTIW